MTLIGIRDVRKSFPLGPTTIEVLKGVDLEVQEGDMLSIVGTSGCGKSTLMNILGFLDTPTSGSYAFKGKETAHYSDDELSRIRNREIGFVFQQFHLLPKLSARENVCLPLIYRGTPEKEQREVAGSMLEKVGLAEQMEHRPNMLSGGQQQRVAIARTLAATPSLILADEPTGALDSKVGQDIMDLFLALNRDEGITVIIITHDPKIAAQCRRQVRMRDGVILEGQ